ncbi:MAG TPA: FCD domain-containing protein [Rhizomicrobium sp.]|jgi:DNA-binding FadR family transcriptional regulator|nr:FCD domain-containing protein [Rhizomicrobium sp.]
MPGAPRINRKSSERSGRGAGHAEIVATLGAEILSGARPPGSRLPSVEEMFEMFGVSRVVLREVTRTLAAKGMVTSKSKVGTRVQDSSHWNWLDPQVLEWRGKVGLDQAFLDHITQVRLAVEPAAARLAARHRSRQDLAALQAALQAMHDAEGNHRTFSEADLAFHIAVSAASGNPMFRSLTAATEMVLFGFLHVISHGVIAEERTHARSTARHGKILEAIEARDEEGASLATIRVIEQGRKHARTTDGGA